MKEYESPSFHIGEKVNFDSKPYVIIGIEGQFDPGSVCWTYKLEGIGYVPEYMLEEIDD